MRTRLLAFWGAGALLVHTHLLYPGVLALLGRLRPRRPRSAGGGEESELPRVSLLIAAHDEEDVIARKVENALALDYPRELLEVVVASDGSSDGTVAAAVSAGADLVLDLPRGGKIATQNAAVERAGGEIIAFSDANAFWEPDALRALVAPFAAADVGYVCGQVRFLDPEGGNVEGAYWRYELRVRELESDLGGVTAGNGAIYAVRRIAYAFLPPSRSHDLSFPFALAKTGFRSLYAPAARAEEKMVPTVTGEFERKRRMMRGLWDIVVTDGMVDPAGYTPLYAFQIFSHRLIRYSSPLLHAAALIANLGLLGRSRLYRLAFAGQAGILISALLELPGRPLRLVRYYVLVTLAIALGTLDRFREGPPAAWERSEGTR